MALLKDDFPFPKMGYLNSLEGIYIKLMIWGKTHYFWKPPYGYPWDIRDIKYFSLEKRAAFRQAIEAPGPRVAYAEGLARAVLCEAGIWCDGLLQVSQATEFVLLPKSCFFSKCRKSCWWNFYFCKVKNWFAPIILFIFFLVPWKGNKSRRLRVFFFVVQVHVVALEHPSCEGRQLRHMWRASGCSIITWAKRTLISFQLMQRVTHDCSMWDVWRLYKVMSSCYLHKNCFNLVPLL